MYFNYDPLNKKDKSVTGAVEISLPFTVSLSSEANSVTLMLKKEGKNEYDVAYPMQKEGDRFSVTLDITTVGLYRYCFVADGHRFFAGKNLLPCDEGERWTITAYEKTYESPEWLYGGIIYQIFPDRFAIGGERKKTKPGMIYRDDWGGVPTFQPNKEGIVENRDMFGGNFLGIEQKLDYLKSLGVTVIYLNPVFEAYSNHKYDTANYGLTDSDFGSLKDFARLIAKAEEKGIKIVLDGVFSHTGADSVYFNKYRRFSGDGAYNSQQSPYYDWYKFRSYPDDYECWWGVKILPNVNENNRSFNQYINGEDGIIRRYIDLGVAGWRLDVADELPDEFLYSLTRAAKTAKKDALVLGEVWENAATKYSYGYQRNYLTGRQLDSVTNYPLKNAVLQFVNGGGADALDNGVRELINDYPARVLHALMNVIDTHDTPRALTSFGDYDDISDKKKRSVAKILNYDAAVKKLKLAAALQYFLPGIPTVFYGDEAGMDGFEDPFNRRCYPWGKEDRALVRYYEKLGKIRTENSGALAKGEYERIDAPRDVFRFRRIGEECVLEIVVNASEDDYMIGEKKRNLIDEKECEKVESMSVAVFK
ncbi:MAG: glycoside hydrolase family 13 protein [Firmicutes bacterium]|nr:glycoside hydrolase family 13 protein [Bacillota bacterium]MDY5531260.1 glycoside hydrolase family 13 protein [Pumilibacteraceae bacterium]